MKHTFKGYWQGYNELLVQEQSNMNMDFGVQIMKQGDTQQFTSEKESIYVLITGEVTFVWPRGREKAKRDSAFHEDPSLLHVPGGTQVTLICESAEAEITIHRTTNSRTFAPRFMRSENLLCASEQRGAGLMNEASTRIVRTFLDRSNCPETNFFIGEVVSYPGKWSSYPPHHHVEPEVYYYKFLPEDGYGYAEIGEDVYKVRTSDFTCMADGVTHSQCTAPGYAEYYLWFIRLRDDAPMETIVDEQYAWAAAPDAKFFPDI